MELVRFCNEKGIRTVSFVGNNTSPVYLESTYKIWIDEDTPESEIGKTISLKIYAYGEVTE